MSQITFGKATLNLIDCELEKNKTPEKAELLRIVRDMNVIEYPRIIAEKAENEGGKGYPYLYHLSDIRGNIVRWLPIKKADSVLELDAECGAITSALHKLSENVSVYVNCATDAEIIAERFSNCKNFVIYAGDVDKTFDAIKAENRTFNWIIVRNPMLLDVAKELLSTDGRIVFITDNRMGMRNLAGVKAEGAEDYFSGIEGKTAAGFTFGGLRKLFAIKGLNKAQLFYPYPDYRFMKCLFSNERLPKTGELTDNLRNFDADRLLLFSEKEAFDASCDDGSFIYYSNSYLAIIGEPVAIEYARFSNERAPEYAIYTTIESMYGEKKVKKQPLTEAAETHIRNLSSYYKRLEEKYAGSKLKINKCNLMDFESGMSADFEYVEGVELSKLMDAALEKDDTESFYKLFDKYVALVGFNEKAPIADIDVVFSNILVNKNEWTLIDYEWCKEGSIPIKETAYRAIYCYLLEDKSRKKFNQDLVLEKLDLSREAAEEIENDELIFQKRVTGRNLSLGEIRERLQFKAVNPVKFAESINDDKGIYKFQIYPGGKAGEFSEESAYVLKDVYKADNIAEATIGVMIEDNIMRVDPLDASCLVTVREAKLGELDFPVESKKYLFSNGKRIGRDTFVFDTADPNLYFNMDGFIHNEDTFLYLKLEIIPLKEDTAKSVKDNIKRIF